MLFISLTDPSRQMAYCQEKQRNESLCSLLWAERLCKQTTGQMSAVKTETIHG